MIVDGRVLVKDKQLLVCDEAQVIASVMEGTAGLEAAYARYHPSGRTLSEQFPPALAAWD